MDIKIYKLIDPISNEIRYIGKTKNTLTKRLYEHLTKRNLTAKTHKNHWINSLINNNLKPMIELVEIVTPDNWVEREMHWIKFYKTLGAKLTNTTEGGEGTTTFIMPKESILKAIKTKKENGTLKRSEECKVAISNSRKGYKHTENQTKLITDKTRFTILQYDLNENFIKKWVGIKECARHLNFNDSAISRAIRLNRPYKGFIWKLLSSKDRN